MSSIRFLSDQIYETKGPGKGPAFKAGSSLAADDVADVLGMPSASDDFAAGFLQRWVNRGAAVYEHAGEGADHATADSDDDGDDGEDADLTKMSRLKLDALAADRGIDISSAKNKADVIAALDAAASGDQQ